MNKIPTFEELAEADRWCDGDQLGIPQMAELSRKHTALHTQAALEAAAEQAKILRKPTGDGESSETYIDNSFEGDLGYEDYIPVEYTIYKDSILNAYPLTNIK